MTFKNTTKKMISLVIVLGFIANFGLSLKQAEAFAIPVIEVGPNLAANTVTAAVTTAQKILYFLKEFIIYPIVRKLANALENKLINKTNSLVSGLTQKTPNFILSWRNFTLDSQARGNDIFRSVLADANLCPYFKSNLQTAFGATQYAGAFGGSEVKATRQGVLATVFQQKTNISGLPSFQNITNCSLPAGLNIPEFKNDFTKGGWTAWNQLIQPQNNFYGVYSLALGEKARQIETELQSSRDQSIAGQGFLGQKLATLAGGGASPAGCIGSAFQNIGYVGPGEFGTTGNRCVFMGKEVTPASVLGATAANALDKKLGRVGGAAQVTDVLLNLLNAVTSGISNRMLNFIGQSSYQVQPSYSPQPTPPGGGNFSTTDVPLTDPTFNGCQDACQGELNTCRNIVPQICTPGPIDPVTGNPGPDVCKPDPNNEANCQAQHNNCTAQCPTTP